MINNPATSYQHILTTAGQILSDRKSLILYSALGPHDPSIEKIKFMLNEDERIQIGRHLGEISKQILRVFGKMRSVVVGGDTSGQVARALDIYALELLGQWLPGHPSVLPTPPSPFLTVSK